MKKTIFIFSLVVAALVLLAGCLQKINDEKIPTFTVTFDVQGRGKTPAALTVPKDSLLTAAQTPPLEFSGWEFGGWYKDATCTNLWNNASDTVTENTTLYAKCYGKSRYFFIVYFLQTASQ